MDKSKYKNADLWSEANLQALCCGLESGGSRPLGAGLNKAEDIRRAVIAGKLPAIAPEDASAGDILYGYARFFRSDDAKR